MYTCDDLSYFIKMNRGTKCPIITAHLKSKRQKWEKNKTIVLPYYPDISSQISHIPTSLVLSLFSLLTRKLVTFTNLKNPIGTMNSWSIYHGRMDHMANWEKAKYRGWGSESGSSGWVVDFIGVETKAETCHSPLFLFWATNTLEPALHTHTKLKTPSLFFS